MRRVHDNHSVGSDFSRSQRLMTPTLFSEEEMEKFILHIDNPESKMEKLFIPYTHKYKQYLYSSCETAKLLGISEKGLKKLREEGRIECNQSGGKVQYYAGDIYRFLYKHAKHQK